MPNRSTSRPAAPTPPPPALTPKPPTPSAPTRISPPAPALLDASRVAELEARLAAKDALITEMVAFLRESSKSSSFNHTKAGELVKKAS